MSGACAKCCSFAGHRGRSQGGYEQVGWEEAAWGGGLSRRRAVAWPASRASPGEESRWDAMSTLSSRAFCSCDSRRGSLRYLSAAQRYTTQNCLLDCDITLIEETGLNWETLYCPHQDCPCYGKPFTAGLLVKNGSSCGEPQAQCNACGGSVALSYGTAYYRLKANRALFE